MLLVSRALTKQRRSSSFSGGQFDMRTLPQRVYTSAYRKNIRITLALPKRYMKKVHTLRPIRRIHPHTQIRYGLILGAMMILVAVVWAGLIRGRDLGGWFPTATWRDDLLIGAAVGSAFGVGAWKLLDWIPALKYVEQIILASLEMDDMQYYHALLFGLLAGIPEEILFRGAMQPALGLLIPAVIFGAFHAINLAYFLYATGAGMLLGVLTNWRGGLWAAITAHTVIDTVMFALLIRRWHRMRAFGTVPVMRPEAGPE
jgi:membrane protease YdiL (CAAX protease family)